MPDPAFLREMAENISTAGASKLKLLGEQPDGKSNKTMLASLVRLISDLGEAVERCERPEMHASTSHYLFWAVDDIVLFCEDPSKKLALGAAAVLLRNYVAYVLLLEAEHKAVGNSK